MTYVKRRGRRVLASGRVWRSRRCGARRRYSQPRRRRQADGDADQVRASCPTAVARSRANYEQDIGGAITAVAEFGARSRTTRTSRPQGWHGGSIGGHPLKLVGIGCANDTADSAIKETKRLMEQLGADMMIGPLSGDESIAVANYAKQHPTKTFVNGTAGAWDTTAAVKAPNFFRFNGEWRPVEGRHRRSHRHEEGHWKNGRDHHGRLQLRLASGAGIHRRLLRSGWHHHEAGVPAAEHDRLLVVRAAAAGAGQGGRLLLGDRRHGHGPVDQGVREPVRDAQAAPDHREPVLLLVRRRQDDRPRT